MSKKQKDKKVDLPPIPDKYMNINKLEETETRLVEDKNYIEKLKNENQILFEKLKRSEADFINDNKLYEKIIDEKTRAYLSSEEELNKLKMEKNNIETRVREELEDQISDIKLDFSNRIDKLTEEVEHFKERYNKTKAKKKEAKEENERLRKECDKLNSVLYNNIQSYEKKIAELKEKQEVELAEMKRREEEFIKSNEELMDTDIYTVYKDVKKKFEDKLVECVSYKGQNEKIVDENKLFKLNLDNSDKLIKECAKIQLNQQKIIKQTREQLQEKADQLDKIRADHKQEMHELNFKLSHLIEEKEVELKRLKHTLTLKSEENMQLRSLSQIILDQRSEIEQFFIESLEEVKIEIYKRKKEMERKGHYFPHAMRKYEEKMTATNSSKKVDIKELMPEDKEKVLRLLFAKINESYKPKSYKNIV